MKCQKHLFQLPDGIHYLNCAYMSPLLKSVEEKGIEGMRQKRNPVAIKPVDFFTGAVGVREKFARMVHAEPGQIALMQEEIADRRGWVSPDAFARGLSVAMVRTIRMVVVPSLGRYVFNVCPSNRASPSWVATQRYQSWLKTKGKQDCRDAWCMNRVLFSIYSDVSGGAELQQTSERVNLLKECVNQ